MNSLRRLVGAELRVFVRDKASLTLTFLFPMLFILIFGALMGDMGGTDDTALGLVAAADETGSALRSVVADIGSLEVFEYDTTAQLHKAIETGPVDFGVAWDGEALAFYYDQRRIQENYTFEEIAVGISSRLQLAAQGQQSVLSIDTTTLGGQADVPWINVVVPGVLAFSILSAGLSAVAGHVSSMKQRKLLDRMIVTPMRPAALLTAIVIVRLLVTFLSTLITLILAIVAFGLRFDINWFQYCALVVCATVGMMGLGTAISLLVRRPSSAGQISSILSITMMFVSGIYFPVEVMPRFLQRISFATPLRHMADAMRYATGVMDMSPWRFWIIAAVLLAIGIGTLPLLGRYVVRSDR